MSDWATLRWAGGALEILDQTLLPDRCEMRRLDTVDAVVEAIRALRVRGAPVLGVCGGYGVVVGLGELDWTGLAEGREVLAAVARRLAAARPTAVNLPVAVERVRAAAAGEGSPEALRERALAEAGAIAREDVDSCERIGAVGRSLLAGDGGGRCTVLTHCNAGRLVSVGRGTALGVVYALRESGSDVRVFACETRPLLQGARLTAWELADAGVDVTVLVDGAACALLHSEPVDAVLVGADRIAANGDTANKVGTHPLALAARSAGVPFYVVAPSSTIDPTTAVGREIVIERRAGAEVTHVAGRRVAAAGADGLNPAFDVTPHELVSGYVTERGVLSPPFGVREPRAASAAG